MQALARPMRSLTFRTSFLLFMGNRYINGSSHVDDSIPKNNPTSEFHSPPPPHDSASSHYYDTNATPFGAILRGERSAVVYAETDHLLAFADHNPQAKFHGLIIPKRLIASVLELQSSDLPFLYDLKELGDQLLAQYKIESGRMVFHIPPFNTVQHLHLHVLSEEGLTWKGRIKYWSETRWCTSWDAVVQRLQQQNESKDHVLHHGL